MGILEAAFDSWNPLEVLLNGPESNNLLRGVLLRKRKASHSKLGEVTSSIKASLLVRSLEQQAIIDAQWAELRLEERCNIKNAVQRPLLKLSPEATQGGFDINRHPA